jgi:dynein heavy chain 1
MIEWSNLRQIYNRKAGQLDNEMDRLKEKVLSDEKRLNEKINDIDSQWNREKPSTNADIVPKDALTLLDTLNMKINNVKDSYSRCCEAKELLGLEPGNLQKLENLRDDIELLREVWNHLQIVWAPYESIRETLITAVTNTKIKDLETEAAKELNKTPAKLKQNEPFEAMKQKVGVPGGSYYLMNKKIVELKS